MLNTQHDDDQRPPVPDPARSAGHCDASIYFGCTDPDAADQHPRDRGADVRPPRVARYGWKQVHVADPDGYVLSFHRPPTSEEKQSANVGP